MATEPLEDLPDVPVGGMPSVFLERRLDGVGLITLNRPDAMNSVGGHFIQDLDKALKAARDDDRVRCVAITGAGEQAFCAGADVKGMAAGPPPPGPDQPKEFAARLKMIEEVQLQTTAQIYEMPKPTVALVNGVAAGGGFAFALACDIRIAAHRARFSTAYARIGLSSDFGTAFLLERVAPAHAFDLLYTGEVFDVRKAERLGIVTHVLSDDMLLPDGLAYCAKIAAGPPLAMRLSKENLHHARVSNFRDTMALEGKNIALAFASSDHEDGKQAFVEKRPARFG